MKQLLVTFVCMILSLSAFAQNRLSFQNNAYSLGDSILYIEASQVNPGTSGADQLWDFSALTPIGQSKVKVLSTDKNEKKSFFPECNMLLQEHGVDFMYKVTDNNILEYGNSSSSHLMRYTVPIVKFVFPFTYGSSFNGTYQGSFGEQGNPIFSGEYATEADAYGTLILPGNVQLDNVLRVKFTQKATYTTTKNVIYRWYANATVPALKYSVLTVMTNETKDSISVYRVAYNTEAAKSAATVKKIGAKEYISATAKWYDVKIFPNPVKEQGYVAYTLPADAKVTLFISDNSGRIMSRLVNATQTKGNYEITFTISKYSPYYIITLVVDGNTILSKIILTDK